MTQKIEFKDGSSIEWKDKETLLYKKAGYELFISVDYYEINFFSAGRLVYSDSIKKWNSRPANSQDEITHSEKQEILRKVASYYEKLRTKYSIK